ncbi:fatty-acid--CoA ligase FadD1 [Williamsia sterculiae]|uniref:Fatty-acyl-CoA synthase n=1 Tax=Williamsia sterculiae TaxID=1344003 RepID=A0A1N7GPP1_9NOCA|nr:fatty-acid--CoA ligase FadD1 [Williamsia sterculiae]SIS14490.1 fatty-acyl-CoA synthase [Williamsia sterculiae]
MQQLLRTRASEETVAVRVADRAQSWREHIREAEQIASAILAMADTSRPMHVGTLLGNTPAMLGALAAGGLGGFTLCGINTSRRGAGLIRDIRIADVQILLVDDRHLPLLTGLPIGDVRVVNVDSGEWHRLVDRAGPLRPYRETTATDVFMLIFTSGTSGDPKAVQVSEMMVAIGGTMLADRLALSGRDVCYLPMPLFHSAAVIAGWATAVGAGATMVPAQFSASGFLADVRRYSVTYLHYVGTALAYILTTPERDDDADNPLRTAFGNEASDRDIADFGRRFGVDVTDGFGSTENGVIVTRVPGTPPGSIGQGLPGVAVFDSATVTECAAAEFDADGILVNPEHAVGELVNTTGRGFFTGYYNDPAAEADRMRHGMYWSGDLAYRDAGGWIYLAGRTADWMRVNGENLAAAPIERILRRHPAISQLAVYAVPDPHIGDQVMVALVLRPGEGITTRAFTDFLAAQSDLSPNAWPRWVRFPRELPATATNKIIKRQLIGERVTVGGEMLWQRAERGTSYADVAGRTPV